MVDDIHLHKIHLLLVYLAQKSMSLNLVNPSLHFSRPVNTVKHKHFWAYSAMKTPIIVKVPYLTIVDGKYFSDSIQKVIVVTTFHEMLFIPSRSVAKILDNPPFFTSAKKADRMFSCDASQCHKINCTLNFPDTYQSYVLLVVTLLT